MASELTVRDLAKLVADMRKWQREYFRSRSSEALEKSIVAEKKVDAAVRECLEQPGLFSRKD